MLEVESEQKPHSEGIATAVYPAPVAIDNQRLATYLSEKLRRQIDPEQIARSTGVRIRYHMQDLGDEPADAKETVPRMAVEAAKQVLETKGWPASRIDIILAATSYPVGIRIAQQIKNVIGANNADAYDCYAACSGAAVALHEYAELRQSLGDTSLVVLSVTPELYSPNLAPDLNVRMFSDGTSATQFQEGEEGDLQIVASSEIWDFKPFIQMPIDNDLIPDGSWSRPVPNNVVKFTMDGESMYRWLAEGKYLRLVGDIIRYANPKGPVIILPHPASARVVNLFEPAMASMGINVRISRRALPKYGNMAAAGWQTELHELLRSESIEEGTTLVFCGVGAGPGGAVVAARVNRPLFSAS